MEEFKEYMKKGSVQQKVSVGGERQHRQPLRRQETFYENQAQIEGPF